MESNSLLQVLEKGGWEQGEWQNAPGGAINPLGRSERGLTFLSLPGSIFLSSGRRSREGEGEEGTASLLTS